MFKLMIQARMKSYGFELQNVCSTVALHAHATQKHLMRICNIPASATQNHLQHMKNTRKSNNKNIVYQYLDKLMNSTKYGVSMTPEVVRLFKFRGIYILQTDYDNKRYVPRFISDILKEGPIFGIEYNKNLYQVILINKMNLVLKSNINFSYGDYPIPPTPPILPYGDTTPIIPPDLPGSSSNKFGPSSNTTTYSTPISYSTKNTINLQSTNITYNLLDTLNITSTQLIAHSMVGMLASRFSLIYADIISNLILINPIGLENYLEYVEYKDISFFYNKELQLQP